jgi:hypothetical protein
VKSEAATLLHNLVSNPRNAQNQAAAIPPLVGCRCPTQACSGRQQVHCATWLPTKHADIAATGAVPALLRLGTKRIYLCLFDARTHTRCCYAAIAYCGGITLPSARVVCPLQPMTVLGRPARLAKAP